MMRKASLFEIIKDRAEFSDTPKGKLSGYVYFIDPVEGLKESSSKQTLEKMIIVYKDYVFSLLEVSLTEDNSANTDLASGNRYRFCAKDIQLEALAA